MTSSKPDSNLLPMNQAPNMPSVTVRSTVNCQLDVCEVLPDMYSAASAKGPMDVTMTRISERLTRVRDCSKVFGFPRALGSAIVFLVVAKLDLEATDSLGVQLAHSGFCHAKNGRNFTEV